MINNNSKASFTPGQHVARQHVACRPISATKLLPVCRPSAAGYKGIQVDRDINDSNNNYVAEIQSTCIPNEQLVAEQHAAVNI